jgi:hypothetical protein
MIARFYAHEIEWPKELTAHQSEEICRLFLLVGQVEDMAEALVKTYDAGFQSGAQSSEVARPGLCGAPLRAERPSRLSNTQSHLNNSLLAIGTPKAVHIM